MLLHLFFPVTISDDIQNLVLDVVGSPSEPLQATSTTSTTQVPPSNEPLSNAEKPLSTAHNEYMDIVGNSSDVTGCRTAERVKASGYEGLKGALVVLRDCFSVFPPLRTTTDGLLDIVGIAEVCSLTIYVIRGLTYLS